jgi:glycosyltransferase involved in cell wall biosynthesis
VDSRAPAFQKSFDESIPNVRLCVVAPYLPTLSETFIRAHLEKLPSTTHLVHSWPPSICNRPALSWPTRWTYKLIHKLTQRVTDETTASYIAAFRRLRPDAVLAEYGPTGALVSDACRRLSIPLIVHFHGYDASIHDVLKEYAEKYRSMFHLSQALIAVSRSMERKLISLGAPKEKVFYNPYGIDCKKFGGADPACSPPVFLAVGRFVEKKAPQLTISAFAAVHRDLPEARLRMIGDGPLLDSARQAALELHVDQEVTFLGPQSHEVVQSEMRTARAFVQHSVEASNGDCEGTPVAILEALASGLPVVSTRHAGIPDVISDVKTGFLVEENDINGMAKQMALLVREPELAGRMGRAGREHVISNFSQEKSIRNLWNIIESTITGRRPPSTLD